MSRHDDLLRKFATSGVFFRNLSLSALRTDEDLRTAWLRIILRLVSVGLLAAFVPWITLILVNAPILAPDGELASVLRFQPYNADYESMLTAIHIVWAVMLWRASYSPERHALFIDFSIWGMAAHGFVMLIATPIQKGLIMTVIEGVPLFVIAAVLWWLRPSELGGSGNHNEPVRTEVDPDWVAS